MILYKITNKHMILKTKEAIKNLAGEDIKDEQVTFTVGKAISTILLEAEGDKMKLFILAQKAYEEKDLDLDDSDLQLVKKAVESTKKFTNLVTGQILQLFFVEETKESAKEK